LDEIKENEYNLNIPRYVDTFEEEEAINIEEVANKIKKFSAEEEDLQKRISEFCDELKIEKPF